MLNIVYVKYCIVKLYNQYLILFDDKRGKAYLSPKSNYSLITSFLETITISLSQDKKILLSINKNHMRLKIHKIFTKFLHWHIPKEDSTKILFKRERSFQFILRIKFLSCRKISSDTPDWWKSTYKYFQKEHHPV